MMGHRLTLGRRPTGRRAYGRGGDLYGTVWRCECGTKDQVNEAPSSGGNAEAVRRWYDHLADVVAAPTGRWYGLSLRLRRQMFCEGYRADGTSCSAHVTRAYGVPGTAASVMLCTPHARAAGDTR